MEINDKSFFTPKKDEFSSLSELLVCKFAQPILAQSAGLTTLTIFYKKSLMYYLHQQCL